jgi:hypothetical protein
MDKEEFFRILEDPCCYNIENYVYDKEWCGMSGLTHITREEYLDCTNESMEGKIKNEADVKRKEKSASKALG